MRERDKLRLQHAPVRIVIEETQNGYLIRAASMENHYGGNVAVGPNGCELTWVALTRIAMLAQIDAYLDSVAQERSDD